MASHAEKLPTHFTLNTGAKIPSIGFGTWKAAKGEAGKAVALAFDAGYRHFDCAPLYYNEKEIGEGFKSTTVPRSDYFVTTKLWSSDHTRVSAALEKSLSDLQLSYVDLYLMHWPITLDPSTGAPYGQEDRHKHLSGWDFRDTWREMEALLSTGKVRAIGVANFSTVNLELLLKTAKVVPAVNQTEIHPFLPQEKLNRYCRERGIHQTAFGPLGGSGGGSLHEEEVVVGIARDRGVSIANVLLSWGVLRGWSVVPKSTNEGRIRENLGGCMVLSEEEMRLIDELSKTKGRRFNRPDWGTTVFHDDEGLDIA